MAKTTWTSGDIERLKNRGLTVVKTGDIRKDSGESSQKESKTLKYRNKKTDDGFDSNKEAQFYYGLKLKEKAGLITGISKQVVFQLSVCQYIADFVYLNLETKEWVVVDVKSTITKKLPTYRLKNKMMLHELGIKIIEV
jgi:hypothetical protein